MRLILFALLALALGVLAQKTPEEEACAARFEKNWKDCSTGTCKKNAINTFKKCDPNGEVKLEFTNYD